MDQKASGWVLSNFHWLTSHYINFVFLPNTLVGNLKDPKDPCIVYLPTYNYQKIYINELNVGKYTYGLNCPVYMFTTRPNCKSRGILQLLLNLEQQKICKTWLQKLLWGTVVFIYRLNSSTWWVNQPIWTICGSQIGFISPRIRVNIKRYLKPATRLLCTFLWDYPKKVTKRILKEALPIFVAEFLFFMAENPSDFCGVSKFPSCFFHHEFLIRITMFTTKWKHEHKNKMHTSHHTGWCHRDFHPKTTTWGVRFQWSMCFISNVDYLDVRGFKINDLEFPL